MRRLPLLCVGVLTLCTSCYTVSSSDIPVITKTMAQPRYVRANLRGDTVFLTSAGDLNLPIAVTAGSPVVIERYGARSVDLRVHHLKYTMYPADGKFDTSPTGVEQFIDKYLVSDRGEIDTLMNASSAIGLRVGGGEVAVGMTKEQVYVSLGAPRWIERQIKTLHLTRDRILESDRWVYSRKVFAELIPQEQAYVFNQGVLVQAIPGS
jgi:hypothetical protein